MALDKKMIGQKVEFKGKVYTITGTKDRSYILNHEGKEYKATPDKLKKIENYNTQSNEPISKYPNLERRIKRLAIFNTKSKIPENKAECFSWFSRLTCELSPENLCCDGELSRNQVQLKKREIMACWREVETIYGKRVSEDEVYEFEKSLKT